MEIIQREINSEDGAIDGWPYWAAIVAGAKARQDGKDIPPSGDNGFEIEFKINGVEVSFHHVMKRIGESFRRAVEKEGKALLEREIREKMNDLEEVFDDYTSAIRDVVKSKFPDLDLEL